MTDTLRTFRVSLEEHGFALLPSLLPASTLRDLTRALEVLAARVPLGERGGARDAFRLLPGLAELAVSDPLWTLASSVLGPEAGAVRAIIFDKTPGANWRVAWHQDVTIAVRERREVAGFGPWTVKAGIPHVRAPAELLSRMLALRVHLDPCGSDNGPVRVSPGSHRLGRLGDAAIAAAAESTNVRECLLERGGILAMHPLLLHASSPARLAGHRRVLHLEYAAGALPGGLEWHERRTPAAVAAGAV
jgi:hypothetical protein